MFHTYLLSWSNSKTNYYISDLVSALNIKSIIDIKEKKDVEETQKKIHYSYDIKFNISNKLYVGMIPI